MGSKRIYDLPFDSPEYKLRQKLFGMISRCDSSRESQKRVFPNYHKYNVKVCDEWKNDPDSFIKWALENGYKPGLVIDRIDTKGNYEPNNCRWVTKTENARNTTRTVYLEYEGKIWNLPELCETYKVDRNLVYGRLSRGWSIDDAISKPVRPSKKKGRYYGGHDKKKSTGKHLPNAIPYDEANK